MSKRVAVGEPVQRTNEAPGGRSHVDCIEAAGRAGAIHLRHTTTETRAETEVTFPVNNKRARHTSEDDEEEEWLTGDAAPPKGLKKHTEWLEQGSRCGFRRPVRIKPEGDMTVEVLRRVSHQAKGPLPDDVVDGTLF